MGEDERDGAGDARTSPTGQGLQALDAALVNVASPPGVAIGVLR